MSGTNKTRQIEWHETCRCKYRLDTSVSNDKKHGNNEKCECECKELIDKGISNKGYISNPSNCTCECDKSCDFGKYLDYENCRKYWWTVFWISTKWIWIDCMFFSCHVRVSEWIHNL